MPAITSLDLSNAKLDVDHIAAIATSTIPTATDRLGHVKDTMMGAVYSIKAFNDRGAWQPTTTYNVKDLVSVTVSTVVTWYVAVSPHTSSSTFSSDYSTYWRVYQGVTSGDLSSTSGSSLVGNGAETVANSFEALQLADYSSLRSYTGPRKSVYVTGVLATTAPSSMSGLFVLDNSSATDDGGIRVGRYRRVFDGPVFINWFGADNKNGTDSSAAIQKALDYVYSLPRGGSLTATPGTYNISAKITLPNTPNKKINFEAYGCTFVPFGGYTGFLLDVGSATEVSAIPSRVAGMTFSAGYLDTRSPSINLRWAGQFTLEDISCLSGGTGVTVANCFALRVVRFNSAYCNGYGMYFTTICNNLQIVDSFFNSNISGDMYFEQPVYNVSISGTDMEAGPAAIVFAQGGAGLEMYGNYIEGKTGLPIFFGAEMTGGTFTGNWLGYNTGAQVWYNWKQGLISDNIFWDQPQSIDPSSFVDVGPNAYYGTSDKILSSSVNMTLVGGFYSVGGSWAVAKYSKDRSGTVRLAGMVGASADQVCFVLPVGFRPSAQISFVSLGVDKSVGRVLIDVSGNVLVNRGTDGTLDLSAVSFKAVL